MVVKTTVNLPDLTKHLHDLVDSGMPIPGWPKTPKVVHGSAAHISAKGLTQPCPGTLAKAFNPNNPDRDIWLASYEEEYNGLISRDTFTIIDESEYKALHDKTRKQAIPSMGVLTIKTDRNGDPVRAKSCIVVLGNHDNMLWTKTNCFAPVVSAPVIRLMAALAVRNKMVLKQGNCKNAFCHTVLPDDEVVCPPANCPISKPNTYWCLNKTLYGLCRSPQHWFHTLLKYFKEISLHPTSHDSCLFLGTPVQGKAPIYVALFVDDFVYFSPDQEVEKIFEKALASKSKLSSWDRLITSLASFLTGHIMMMEMLLSTCHRRPVPIKL